MSSTDLPTLAQIMSAHLYLTPEPVGVFELAHVRNSLDKLQEYESRLSDFIEAELDLATGEKLRTLWRACDLFDKVERGLGKVAVVLLADRVYVENRRTLETEIGPMKFGYWRRMA